MVREQSKYGVLRARALSGVEGQRLSSGSGAEAPVLRADGTI